MSVSVLITWRLIWFIFLIWNLVFGVDFIMLTIIWINFLQIWVVRPFLRHRSVTSEKKSSINFKKEREKKQISSIWAFCYYLPSLAQEIPLSNIKVAEVVQFQGKTDIMFYKLIPRCQLMLTAREIGDYKTHVLFIYLRKPCKNGCIKNDRHLYDATGINRINNVEINDVGNTIWTQG